ncbi:MAG: DUF4010 domain-containing protein [Candidatus Diapherotrites archaeon]|nr:DUF4010 domain-containing protein [Candidatus Diapherotrites archaeon]
MAVDVFLFLQRLLVALAIGALIGIEREFTKKQKVAGLRTFSLVSALGAVSTYISILSQNTLILLVSYIGVIVFAFTQYVVGIEKHWRVGLTTLLALIMSFLAGSLVFYSLEVEAVLVTLLVTIILFERVQVRRFVSKLTYAEVSDSLEFIVVAFILFSFVPETALTFNGIEFPIKEFFSFIFFVSIVSFVGFIMSRILPVEKNFVVSGMASGLISYSAFVAKFRELTQANSKLRKFLHLGILGAFTTVFLRNLILISFFSLTLFWFVLPAFASMSLLMMLALIFAYYKTPQKHHAFIKFKNPFSVTYAFKFGLAFATILLAGNVARVLIGPEGYFWTIIVLSLFSSSGAIASAAFLFKEGQLTLQTAGIASVLGASLDILVKNLILYKKGTKSSKVSKVLLYAVFVAIYGISFVILTT